MIKNKNKNYKPVTKTQKAPRSRKNPPKGPFIFLVLKQKGFRLVNPCAEHANVK